MQFAEYLQMKEWGVFLLLLFVEKSVIKKELKFLLYFTPKSKFTLRIISS